jgi:hypothetical protein
MTHTGNISLCGAVVVLFCQYATAQLPEDVTRLTWMAPSGTARQQAIGGAMGSLGGEISSVFVNPAGLGMYRSSELVISPGFQFAKDHSNFRGTSASGAGAGKFNIGASGIVLGLNQDDESNNAFSIAVNQTGNFKNNLLYRGQNDYSSYSEQYAEEFANSGLGIDEAISSPSVSYGTRMALYTYLIDTATINGQTKVIGLPQNAALLNQQYNAVSRGGITEIALSYAGSYHNKWYVGLTLGIPIYSYSRMLTFTESDATGNTNNNFASSTYSENYTSKGAGGNLKVGLIYKPMPALRLGFAIHSSTTFALKDNISASMTTNTENYAHIVSINSAALDAGSGTTANESRYNAVSPWKFILSAAYVFQEIEEVTKQRGFITADLEYVTNSGSYFSANENSTLPDSYFSAVNQAIRAIYKNSFNLRVGGELKFNIWAARAGFAFYGSPYAQTGSGANRMYISAGAGYRNKGVFIDLTYVLSIAHDINYPYRLADKANTFASIKENGGTILLTLGLKLL